jgi:response regulator of citrate/malate metabolism
MAITGLMPACNSVDFQQGGKSMHIHEVAGETPNTANASVARTRRYLTGREVEKLIEAARKHGRYGHPTRP